jgi:hypothetical protein
VTVAAWVKVLSPPSANAWQCLVGQGQPNRNYNLYIRNAEGTGRPTLGKWRVYFSYRWGQPGWCETTTGYAFGPADWHHVAATATTEAGGRHRYYVDGSLAAEFKNVGFARLATNDANHQIGWGSSEYDGCLDDVRIYNRALAADEVARLARGGTSPPAP